MKKVILIPVFCLFSLALLAQYNYPATKTVDSTHTYFGTTYKDQYGWLENMKDTSVITWFKKQSDFSTAMLNKLSGRDELIAEWKKLDKLQPPSISGVIYENGSIFYRKTMPGESVGKLYYRSSMIGKEVLLFDPLNYIKNEKLSLEGYLPSHDARLVAIAYSKQGAEISTIKIMDVATHKFLHESIFPTWGIESFSFDNKTLLYLALKTADNTDPTGRLNPKTKLHKIGTSSSNDLDFFSAAKYPDLNITPKDYPGAFVTEDNKNYVFSSVGNVQPEWVQYYAPIAQYNSPHIQWKVLCKYGDSIVRGMEIVGNKLYAISHDHAQNFKLLETSIENPDWQNATVVAPEKKDQTLEAISHCKDYLFEQYSDGINSHIYKYNFATGKLTVVKLPFTGSAYIFAINDKSNDCIVEITSWAKPFTEFAYDPVTGKFSPSPFNKPANYPAAYTTLQVKETEVKGHDGAMIPLSIIYKAGTKLDGNNVCLLDGYGAYGISMTPYFSILENALAVRGVVVAIPHVRGGSEKGQSWYKAGYKTTKPNTWKDFNSCAEYLIEKGYTNPSKLAGTGTSAGGILISRAITERPDLYAAAICNVGCANAMRMEFSANGPGNIPEFGTVKDSVECKALYVMDGVQHVVPGTKYPALICVGGWNDPRVIAWQPGKFAAAVQNASTSGKPVIMKVNYDDGHFTEDRNVTYHNFADQFAFVLWQCGHPDFQLKAK